jgi:type IV pilus assembly protein PilW
MSRRIRIVAQAARQRGVSLVELMVGVALSLFVLTGIITVYAANRQSFQVQTNLAEIQEAGRFAVDTIARAARLAGYQGDSPSEWVLGALSQTNGGVDVVSGANDDTSDAAIKDGTDSFTVVYQASSDGLFADCLGLSTAAAGSNVSNTFSISASNALQCSTDGGASHTALLENVENMQVLYGVDTDDDQQANSYVTANKVSDWGTVVSLRVALLVRSRDDGVALAADTRAWQLLDKAVYTSLAPANDNRVRRIFSSTIRLRNRL